MATDDGERVKLGHFGDARYYLHYVRCGSEGWRLERRVENPYASRGHGSEEHGEHGGKGHGGKRAKILELNRGCNAIVATALGPGGREFMEKHGLRVIIVRPYTSIEEALRRAEEELGLARAARG
ncbi:hypothetical protein CF15_01575 [Pyrodictium occultum]|uniref:Dinitrogenase iron-molybdenum cofactor biosynthesis domain-containing protein n=1 Tax=Pyrodictium occultum TaxID=2309 RepID=A0A0V8RU12_PYROC|nr:hypothetical protein CF15_01575 [Pyrodictium occultum]